MKPTRRAAASFAHPLDYPDGVWFDPITGVEIPKTTKANLEYRKKILLLAEDDGEAQLTLRTMCADSFLFFCNTFGWSQKQRETLADGRTVEITDDVDAPIITWPVHDALAGVLQECLANGEDLVIKKSRDMWASWFCLLFATWLWMFKGDATILLNADKEETVDSADPGSLMPRIDYVLGNLPHWLRPEFSRTSLSFINPSNGAAINGFASTKSVGRGKRKTIAIFDEFAWNPKADDILNSTKDVTSCRVFVSSVMGPGAFKDLCRSGRRMFVMPYWDHPSKGAGRELRVDTTGYYTKRPGSTFWWTPFFEHELKYRTPLDVAQNLLMDDDLAGAGVFDTAVVVQAQAAAGVDLPTSVGDLRAGNEGEDRDEAIRARDPAAVGWVEEYRLGRTKLWLELSGPANNRRPTAGREIVLFADVSNGLSSSNSAIVGFDADTGEQVLAFADPTIDPSDLARLLCELGIWLGGPKGSALIGWEANGPGQVVAKHVLKLHYPRVYQEHGKEPGWHNEGKEKRKIIEELGQKLTKGDILIRDPQLLAEMTDYVYGPAGVPLPARVTRDRDAQATHGDRVVAAAGAAMLMEKTFGNRPRYVEPKAPPGSLHEKMQKAIKAIAREARRPKSSNW